MSKPSMTSLQRVLTALSHKEPDRVPLFLLVTMHGAKELGLSIKDYFSKAEHVAEGQLRLRAKYRHDCIYNFYYAAVEVEAWGMDVLYRAVGGQESLNEAFEAGATDYIAKPVKKVELLARVRSALRLHEEMERRKIREKELIETLEQLQSAQAQLLRTKKLASIGILSAGVAHEILNPLNIISTTAQLLMMDEPKGPIHEKMREILGQIQRAVKIVNNLGMFASKNRMEVEDVSLPSCFEQAAGSVEQDLKANNIVIERHFAPDVPLIKGDANQMEQVFSILISNARDAMSLRGQGTITAATRSAEHGIEFKFCDDGPGISADIIEKVFDPFFTTKDPGKGTGLGLSIAHRIIEDHGGTLAVESEAGKTCFTIFLPKDGGPVAAG